MVASVLEALSTPIPRLRLCPLGRADAESFYDLVQQNRDHLTRLGDYGDLVDMSLAETEASLSGSPPADPHVRMGLWLDDHLIGRADLSLVTPEIYVLGYWVDGEHMGNGYVTTACKALIDAARARLEVKEIWAGVKRENTRSIAVLKRLGFSLFEDVPTHSRYLLACA